MRNAIFLFGAFSPLTLAACTPAPTPPPKPMEAAPTAEARAALPPKPVALRFIEDDIEGARAEAAKGHKVLVVDVWAPWCHTCLSMKSFVLNDPKLAPLAEVAVFASIDFDKPVNASFLEKHGVHGLPTMLAVDPGEDKILGMWLGSGSAREVKAMIETASAVMPGGKAAVGPAAEAAGEFAKASRARAEGRTAESGAAFQRAVEVSPADWPLRSEAILGFLSALEETGEAKRCAEAGRRYLGEVSGSSLPSDVAVTLLGCAEKLSGDEQKGLRNKAIERLQAFVAKPPPDAAVDDRGDAYANLAEALEANGDAAGAKAAREAWAKMLEEATKAAVSIEAAHTFDYQRANALLALGRGEEAATMLVERARQLPDSYEPPARLARVYFKLGKLDLADKACAQAIEKSYGPRRLQYLHLRADIAKKAGDKATELRTLKDEVQGWEALPRGQAAPKQLADAKKRLAEAEGKPLEPSAGARP